MLKFSKILGFTKTGEERDELQNRKQQIEN